MTTFSVSIARPVRLADFEFLGSKNIVAFGFLYGIVPWVEEVGYIDCFGAQAGIFVAVIGLGMLILIPFGAKIRHRQAHWRIII